MALLSLLAAIRALIVKDLLAMVKDPANRIVLFAPVLIQTLLFGYGATFDLTHVPYALLDQSHGGHAVELVRRVEATGVFRRAATLDWAGAIAPAIDDGSAALVIVIPPDFETRVAGGQPAPVQIVLDGRNSSTASLASAQLGAIIAGYDADLGLAAPLRIETRYWHNPDVQSRWSLLTALIASLSLLQTLLVAALSVAREREQGTFDQLLVTPLTPWQIMIGKAVPAILIGVIQSSVVVLVIRLWFQIPLQGSPLVLYGALIVFTTAAVGIGMSISALSLTMQQAMLFSFFLTMPLTLLSGLLTPVSNMPAWLQVATFANPLRFGIDMVRRIWLEGAGTCDIAFDFVPLAAQAMVTMPLAAWLFRNRLT